MLSTDTQRLLAHELKQQTAQAHEALEALIVPQIHAVRHVDDYAALLKTFYGFNQPTEAAIQKVLNNTIVPDIHKRQKAYLLLEDLMSIGVNERPPVSEDIPHIQSIEQAFGALYVLEGSTLGGKSISQLLLKTGIGLQPENLHFFNAYGKETGPMWLNFLNQLNSFHTVTQQAIIIHTANETFLKFKHWIQQQPQVS